MEIWEWDWALPGLSSWTRRAVKGRRQSNALLPPYAKRLLDEQQQQ
jgi:hypothetical protein